MCHLVPQFRPGSLINMRIMPRILIVDDDQVTSLLLSDLLVELGYEVLGPSHSVSAALALLDNCQPDAAIIDVTSRGIEPWVRFSPFYPHGGIPIPNSPSVSAQSVEGLWQGLKVFAKSD